MPKNANDARELYLTFINVIQSPMKIPFPLCTLKYVANADFFTLTGIFFRLTRNIAKGIKLQVPTEALVTMAVV